MRGLNKVILIGNAGGDPEFKTLNDGSQVARFHIATTETYRTKSGESGAKTEWHTVVAWRGLAKFVTDFVHKGSLLYVEGKLQYRQYDTREGQKKNVAEIVADQILLLDKKTGTVEKEEEGPGDYEIPF